MSAARSAASVAALALLACNGERPRDVARSADAATARPADASVPDGSAPACEDPTRAFRFGTLAAPAGWCWRRTAEGDDQSGVLVDERGRVRMRYYAMSFDEQVGDACDARRPGVRAIRDDRVRGVAFRACELDDGRHCVSFHGAANLCTELPESPPFSPLDLIR